jgi:hypothetical protein
MTRFFASARVARVLLFGALSFVAACSSGPSAQSALPGTAAVAATRIDTARHGMVVSASSIASDVGRDVLAKGVMRSTRRSPPDSRSRSRIRLLATSVAMDSW